ncbi:hypothetical protein BEP19_15060 [Ammoniphilus oxalaticus]|uniref:DUF1828 domain-containing protein n=1 Tax=Ammoniphilus oxalaticus TaxID=66863 RepID=A0A419SDD3_9BACL|nr:DUF1829 domain-containing protein [Ammoniphilus oxalaticus]RKD21000.1 hypothetical protein BEP19_15060 [Ammoniphilus oxalaticus]
MDLQGKLKSSYLDWLNERISLRSINGAIEITSPMLDRHNDFLQIYVVPDGDAFRLTDDGYIINDLLMSGCEVDSTPRRKEIFQLLLNGYGVQRSDRDELFIKADIGDFPQKKHLLLQAMLSVNDMFMVARPHVQSIFLEDVENFLLDNDIRFFENINFSGRSGYSHTFDFGIPKSKASSERLIKTINHPTRDASQALLWAWSDTKEARKGDPTLYAFLNNSDSTIKNDVIDALSRYDVKTVLWTERDKYISELTA